MSRGTQRPRGAKSSGRGAAEGSGHPPAVAPTESKAAPKPEAKRGPGRPAARPLAGRAAAAPAPAAELELVNARAIVGRLEDVANRARDVAKTATGARDAAAALSVEARCVTRLYDIRQGDDQAQEIRDIKAQLAAMNAFLAGKKGSAQRADVAPAPRVARGAGALQ